MTSKLMITLLASCLTGAAFAAGTGYSSGSSSHSSDVGTAQFDRLDSNKDGKLSKSELSSEPALKEDWARIDTNKDDKLDRAEFSKFETMEDSGTGTTPNATPGTGMGGSGSSTYQ